MGINNSKYFQILTDGVIFEFIFGHLKPVNSMDRSTWMSETDRDTLRANAMRQRMLERKSRILDPRQRRIGIDVEALAEQVAERKEREAREKARDEAFAHQTLDQQRLLLEAAERERQQRKMMADREAQFRMSRQRPDQAREYDIWRPDLLKVSRPGRVGDYDPTIGISSGQIFQGEDLKISERLAAQARQRNEWNAEQMREKAAIKRREQMEDLRNQLTELETQKTLMELDADCEAAKAAVRRQVADDNYAMAQAKRQREAEDRAREMQVNDAELRTNARTRIIREEMARRGDAPMEYRGMTVDEQKQIITEQKRQMEDNERRRREEAERERQWAEYLEYLREQGDLNEAEWRRRKAQEEQQLYQTRLEQEREFKDRQRYLNREVYGKNIPDDSYYDQWGRDVR